MEPIKAIIVFQDGSNLEGASITTLDEFFRLNDDLSHEDSERINNMKIGEKLIFGGGAAGIFHIERINDL
jgi:hypothetical protein